jgi:hypothetical protein
MSQVKHNMIWQHNTVLPYILGQLRQTIEAITPVQAIYLYGSRAYTPVQEWAKHDGKDWDVLVVCHFAIINTKVWTIEKNYYIDLTVAEAKKAASFLQQHSHAIELYPNYTLPINLL